MIPKDKAHQLVTRFYLALPNNGSQTGINNIHSRWEEGKMCALMAVDEYINYFEQFDGESITPSVIEYWQEVKQEIENID
jgi:hypothetical protein